LVTFRNVLLIGGHQTGQVIDDKGGQAERLTPL